MSELLLALDLGQEQREYADIMHRSSIALLQVLNDVLDFSRIEAGRLDLEHVAFRLPQVAQDIHKMFSFATTEKGLDFVCDSSSINSGLVVMGDPGRLRQIIINLLSNSVKFTATGSVQFHMTCDSESETDVTVKFEVEDSGIGISEDVRERLFQPFTQGDASTARRFGGTGLGLTICKNLLHLMNGRVDLNSEIGRGTRVTFWVSFTKAELSLPEEGDVSLEPGSAPNAVPVVHASIIPPTGAGDRRRPSLPKTKRSSSTTMQLVHEERLPKAARAKLHILVVEDK